MRAKLTRDEHGIFHIAAAEEIDRAWGLGYAHATDRALQLLFMRLLGRGELSKYLDSSDASLEIDTFFRRMNWAGGADEVAELTERARAVCSAYAEGINAGLAGKVPWELKFAGYKKLEPWTTEDGFLLARMTSYLTLAQSQGEMERLLVQMVQAGVRRPLLDELFPGQLDGLDEGLLRQVTVVERIVPESVKWATGGARMMASNNWVIGPERSESGKAMLANDPHLEVNRLPAVWYEAVIEGGDRWAIAATMPGIPGLVTARTPDLAWGPTYAFMDAIDSWVEHCKDGQFRRGEHWESFDLRHETIERKGKPPVVVTFYENMHGVLEGDPSSVQEQHLLCTRWAGSSMGARSFNAMIQMWDATDVESGMAVIRELEGAFSWVLADSDGNIGFQMSGLMPARKEAWLGFVPMPGWIEDNDWRGVMPSADLPRCLNPEAGFFATANQDLNAYGVARPITVHQGPYRADRIAELIRDKKKLSREDMAAIQLDMRSAQAPRFMDILRPLLPDTHQGKLLAEWDYGYELSSRGAFLFERVYQEILQSVFGPHLGEAVLSFLWDGTGMFADFFINFDRVLLSEESSWFVKDRATLYREAADRALQVEPRPWGQDRQLVLSHILFGGKLPGWMGFDRGPIQLAGGRATPHQGQLYRSGDRATSFAPSIRFLTDFAEDAAHTRLIGGVSDRRFSKLYCNELGAWLAGTYKKLQP